MNDEHPDLVQTAALRARLVRGEACLGCWLTVADPLAVETLAADCSLDWVQVDLEHSGQGWHGLQMILLGWKGCRTPLFVRVPSHDRSFLGRVLDVGASGVIIPFVNSAAEAERVVAACRYPPTGARGFGPRRASRHYTQTEAYHAAANESVFVIVQIEHAQAVENLEGIAKVDGVDALFIGPADLSFSLDVPLQWEHPKLLSAIRRVIEVGKEHGIPVAMAVDDSPQGVARWLREGIQMATIGVDAIVLRQALKQTAADVRRLLAAEVDE